MSENQNETPSEETLAQGWGAGEEAFAKNSGGDFLKLASGDSHKIIFVGDPVVYKKQWPGDDKPAVRARIPVYVEGLGTKTLDVSKTVFKTIKRQADKRGEKFGRCLFEFSREGSTKDNTSYALDFESVLEQAELDAMLKSSGANTEVLF